MYFPRNRVAPFKSHRCPRALLGRLPQVSFNTSLIAGGKLFISCSENGLSFHFPFPSLPSWGWRRIPREMRNEQEKSPSPTNMQNYFKSRAPTAWQFDPIYFCRVCSLELPAPHQGQPCDGNWGISVHEEKKPMNTGQGLENPDKDRKACCPGRWLLPRTLETEKTQLWVLRVRGKGAGYLYMFPSVSGWGLLPEASMLWPLRPARFWKWWTWKPRTPLGTKPVRAACLGMTRAELTGVNTGWHWLKVLSVGCVFGICSVLSLFRSWAWCLRWCGRFRSSSALLMLTV